MRKASKPMPRNASSAQMRPIVTLAWAPPGKQSRVLEHQRHRAIETRRAE